MRASPPKPSSGFYRLLTTYYLPHWRIFAVSSVFALLTALAVASYGLLVASIVGKLELGSGPEAEIGNGDKVGIMWLADQPVGWLIGVLVFVVIIRSVSLYATQVLSNKGVQDSLVDVQNAQFQALNHGDFARLAKDNSGEWVSRFINDVTVMRDAGLRVTNDLTRGVLTVVFCVVAMLILDWKLTLAIFLFYPIAILPVVNLGARIRKRSKQAQEQMGDLTSLLSESFRATRIVRAYGLESYQDGKADKGFKERSRLFLKVLTDRAAVDPILEIVGGFALAGILAVTAWRISIGDTNIGNFVGIITAIGAASPAIRALGTLNTLVQEAGAASDRFFTILDAPKSVKPPAKPTRLQQVRGEISFENVHFSYDSTPVLNGISFTARPQETLAIVGPSGAGKSTLFNLILRLYDPQSGAIRLDGRRIDSLALKELRAQMALVSQNPVLFDETITANIGMGKSDADVRDIKTAAERANADVFIGEFPDGFQTQVGEMGSKLSGGQCQRISLARAFVRDAPILLLDEATSALDAESEATIQQSLDSFSGDKTTLIIAHRLSTIRRADRILVLDAGHIVEDGNYDALISRNGLFAKLARLQFS